MRFLFFLFIIAEFGISQIIRPSLVTPRKVEILLTSTIYNSSRQPLLHFRCMGAMNSQYWSSDLFIDQICFQDSVKLENINIMNHPFYNFSEVVLFPKDVYILYIAGDVKDNINYIPSIIEFGQNLGFKHANKIYPQIPNNCRDRAVYFVIHDPIVNKLQKGRSINLGNLPDYPRISVHLNMISSWGDHL